VTWWMWLLAAWGLGAVPVVTGTGRRLELDSDGMPRLIVAEACDEIDPRLWDLFAQGLGVSTQARDAARRASTPGAGKASS